MDKPDYDHSIVTLLEGIARRFAPSPTPSPLLPGTPERPLLLLIIDGLGDRLLQNFPESFLARHRREVLHSVFPTTTASAMTSFLTGVAPQQHAITGWFTWFRELGTVTTVLPFTPRYRGAVISRAGVSPRQLIGAPSLFGRLAVPSQVIYPRYIVDSDYTRTTCDNAPRHGYDSLSDFFELLGRLAEGGERQLLFAYWPMLDAIAHQYGVSSDKTAQHLAKLDAACAEHFPRLSVAGLDIVVTADHGLIDTDEAHTIQLADHPELAGMLTMPLCGEPRTAFCYVRANRGADFEQYVREQLGHACELHRSEALIAAGLFGNGEAHGELSHRVGDYTLLMKENYVIKDRLITEKPFSQIGIHGGLSDEERFVPLITYPARSACDEHTTPLA